MRMSRMLTLGASLLVLLSACSTGGGSKPTIKIGSVGFDEAKIVAELYAQVLEANGYVVDRSGFGIGDRKVLLAALESGQIDLQPEYIGSGLAYYSPGAQTGDPQNNFTKLQAAVAPKNITVLNYTPAQDQNAFVVRPETATQFNLTKMSDLTPVASQLKFGVATDCPTNPVCGQALMTAYGIDVSGATKLAACSTPMANALKAKTIDVAELCSTQPDILVNGWKLLTDDKQTQPADNIAPMVRNDFLAKTDKTAFSKLLNDLSAKIDTPTLADLFKQVNVDHKDIKAVATTWLKAQGIVK
jgi:osmoprotectant transport system substrate-binding protein